MPPVPPPKSYHRPERGQPEKQTLCAVLHTYDPLKETKELKSLDKFYYFRSHYPLRREYNAFTVINADPTLQIY